MRGIGAVGGMAMARLYLVDDETPEIDKSFVDDTELEYQRLIAAREISTMQLEVIMKDATEKMGQEYGEIFDYQILMLEDKDFFGAIKNQILNENVNCEYAINMVAQKYINELANIDNDYLRERTTDVADLAKRLIFALSGKELKNLSSVNEDCIIAAMNLTPTQTAGINKEIIKGIILENGGKSSHSVIIARSMGIPCIVGAQNLLKSVKHGDISIINGDTGEIIISPNINEISKFENYEIGRLKEKQLLNEYLNSKSKTKDGFEVKVFANITSENETDALIQSGGEGVGLFRTEFIYMQTCSPPSEENQYKVYSNIAKALGRRPFIIRTLDAGGDKEIPYLKIEKEENPFLGVRAIRYCLENPEIFKTQISAILRAGVYGNIDVMIPMIATLTELYRTKEIIEEVKSELNEQGIKFSRKVRLGIMVETPAAAFMADTFAKEVDFFSIGTNDLTQYLFAADRMNEKVAYLNSYYEPALLHTVKHICDSAKRNNISVDICGQAGENPLLIPLWVAMGVDNLSVSIPSILKVRKIINSLYKRDALQMLERTLNLKTAEEVKSYLETQFYR